MVDFIAFLNFLSFTSVYKEKALAASGGEIFILAAIFYSCLSALTKETSEESLVYPLAVLKERPL